MLTDSELIWLLFCTYMDFHLSPSSVAASAVSEFNKPFTNVFFVKSDGKMPLSLGIDSTVFQQQDEFPGKFFVRMVSLLYSGFMNSTSKIISQFLGFFKEFYIDLYILIYITESI